MAELIGILKIMACFAIPFILLLIAGAFAACMLSSKISREEEAKQWSK